MRACMVTLIPNAKMKNRITNTAAKLEEKFAMSGFTILLMNL